MLIAEHAFHRTRGHHRWGRSFMQTPRGRSLSTHLPITISLSPTYRRSASGEPVPSTCDPVGNPGHVHVQYTVLGTSTCTASANLDQNAASSPLLTSVFATSSFSFAQLHVAAGSLMFLPKGAHLTAPWIPARWRDDLSCALVLSRVCDWLTIVAKQKPFKALYRHYMCRFLF